MRTGLEACEGLLSDQRVQMYLEILTGKDINISGDAFSPIVQDEDAVIPYLEGPKTEAKPYKCGVSSFIG